jgi:LysR family cyn operon transcriptional activator
MELTQLRYFVTIAETMSFTVAAELLHVSQPALSYQMRNLERELGTRLFDRKGRRIGLTADGELFLPLAQGVLYRANEAVRLLREHMGAEEGEVRLGCSPSVATYIVPGMLTEFSKDYPRVRVQTIEGGDLIYCTWCRTARSTLRCSLPLARLSCSK